MRFKYLILLSLFFLSSCPRQTRAQVPVTLNPYSRQQFLDVNGTPLAGGCVFTYQAGTTTPLATYTDYTGMFQNTNPMILDSAGEGVMWLTVSAYKFVLFAAGGVNCASGVQQWTIDFVTPPPFLNGNNTWTGNQVFNGTSIFNAAVTLNNGGTLNGTFSGSPNFSGNPTFSGSPIFTNVQAFPSGIKTDSIQGTFTNGNIFQFNTASGAGSSQGEPLNITTGLGGTTGQGGYFRVATGNGGPSGAAGGAISFINGLASGGNVAGGSTIFQLGTGSGNGNGGLFSVLGAAGGNSGGTFGSDIQFTGGPGGVAGNGGSIRLIPGAAGAGGGTGNVVLEGSGRTIYQVDATAAKPSCTSTGLDTGNCSISSYSTDSNGVIVLAAGTSPAASGVVTLTFNQSMGTLFSICQASLQSGSANWSTTSSFYIVNPGIASTQIVWATNGGVLTSGQQYDITYSCVGRQ